MHLYTDDKLSSDTSADKTEVELNLDFFFKLLDVD